jgi:NAD(P)-dependent dehydrogenase (short-subunit alcohol dehydrogenase family)
MSFAARPEGISALVTGAASGIGRSVAMRLAQSGLPVAVVDLNGDGAKQTVAELAGSGARTQAYQADVSDEDQVADVFRGAEATLGPIGVLVNVAGIQTSNAAVHDTTLDEWRRVLRINLNSVFLCSRAALPGMLRLGWGRIVSTSSVLSARGRARTAPYAASKAGIVGFTRSLALEVAGSNITVNAILPSMVGTPLVRLTVEQIRARGKELGIGRVAEPEEVAGVVAFLASDDASYVSGHSLAISGGSYILA